MFCGGVPIRKRGQFTKFIGIVSTKNWSTAPPSHCGHVPTYVAVVPHPQFMPNTDIYDLCTRNTAHDGLCVSRVEVRCPAPISGGYRFYNPSVFASLLMSPGTVLK